MPKTKNKIGVARNTSAAAAKLGLPESAIQAARDAGCSAFRQNSNIQCDELLEFFTKNPDVLKNSTDVPDFKIEKSLDMRANRMLKEQKLSERDKKLIPIETIRRAWTSMVVSCKQKLYTAENAIAVEVGMKLGLSSEKIAWMREIITKHHRLAIKELHSGEYGKTECPNCKKEI